MQPIAFLVIEHNETGFRHAAAVDASILGWGGEGLTLLGLPRNRSLQSLVPRWKKDRLKLLGLELWVSGCTLFPSRVCDADAWPDLLPSSLCWQALCVVERFACPVSEGDVRVFVEGTLCLEAW